MRGQKYGRKSPKPLHTTHWGAPSSLAPAVAAHQHGEGTRSLSDIWQVVSPPPPLLCNNDIILASPVLENMERKQRMRHQCVEEKVGQA